MAILNWNLNKTIYLKKLTSDKIGKTAKFITLSVENPIHSLWENLPALN